MASQQDQRKLFTPGPLSTSMTVKKAMLRDVFPRGDEFTKITKDVQHRLLDISGASSETWCVVLLQGTGTYGLEAVVHTAVPKTVDAKVLVLNNGFYADRLSQICKAADILYDEIHFGEAELYDLGKIRKQLSQSKYVAVVLVHCETSCGLVNPIEEVAVMVRSMQPSAAILVDSMSSFSAIPLSFENLDFVVSSANKVIQGVPGFAFIFARRKLLEKCKGNERTLCLDLVSQHEDLDKLGQFRFTPPSHVLLAAQQALIEYEAEGGPEARRKRYLNNTTTLLSGARRLGFKTLLPDKHLSLISTSFMFPNHPKFSLLEFSQRLWDKGFIIFPNKLLSSDSFRIGSMGNIFPSDVEDLLENMEEVLKDMDVPIPVP